MKFLSVLLLTALLGIAACLFAPWWSIAIVAYLVAFTLPLKPAASFAAGFLALFLSWGGISWYMSAKNGHLLAQKVSMVIIQTDNAYLLILITAAIGALVAGLGALAGSLLRQLPK